MTRPVLHGAVRSSAAYRVRIALHLKQLEVEQVAYQLRTGEQHSPDFRRLNPAGLVPAFVTEHGDVVTQSLAIIEYLDELIAQPPLLPKNALERARVRSLALGIACDVHPIQNLRVLQHLHAQFTADDEAASAWARHFIGLGFSALETELSRSPFTGRHCHGDAPTLADICLVPQLANARRFKLDLAPFPTLTRIEAACAALPAFERARPEAQ